MVVVVAVESLVYGWLMELGAEAENLELENDGYDWRPSTYDAASDQRQRVIPSRWG